MDNLKKEMKMMNAISSALKYRKENPTADNSKITKNILKIIQLERKEEIKLLIISAVSRVLDIAERNPRFSDRDIIQKFIREGFPELPQQED